MYMKKVLFWLFLTCALVSLDWGTKYAAVQWVPGFDELFEYVEDGPKYCLALTYNTDVGDRTFFSFCGLILSIGIIFWAWTTKLPLLGSCLWTAAAIGNSVEALVNGRVVDFIGVKMVPYGASYQVYNIADMMLFAGAAVMLVGSCISYCRGELRIWDLIMGSRWVNWAGEFGIKGQSDKANIHKTAK